MQQKDKFRYSLFFIVLCLFLFLSIWQRHNQPATFPLAIQTASETVHFLVDVANTKEEQSRGLMFRNALPDKYGMLFDFHTPQQIYMWMKNTPLSLDMLFIDNHGVITKIAAHTTPESTAIITAGANVRAVLELAGGEAARDHIAIGNRVLYSIFQ